MNTADKLAEALRRCEQVIREACEEDPGKWDWAAINADEGAQAREALAAHEQAQAGDRAMASDWSWTGVRMELEASGRDDLSAWVSQQIEPKAHAGEPVVPYLYVYEYDSPFGLNREFYPSGWNGQKPTRTVPLYTTPQPALAQRREPLTDEQIRREKPVCADWASFRAGVRCAERIHGVGK